nr:kinesin light chain isoform X2 [Parasteatoda tepidariorum]
MFSGAKMRLFKWKGKKATHWNAEVTQPSIERSKIVAETKQSMEYLENLHDEYKKILNQLLEQLPTLSENGDDKNSLIQQKVDVLKKNLVAIERGLADSQIFLMLNNIVENIETEVNEAELEIKSMKDNIKSLKSENNSLRQDLSLAQRKLVESEEQSITLEVEIEQLNFMNSLLTEEPIIDDTSDGAESLDLSFIDEKEMEETSCSFPNLPCLSEIDLSSNPRLKIFFNLVMGYITKGSYEIAAPLCKTTLQDLQEKCGPAHPDVISMMDIITLVYRGMSRYKDAAKMQRDVLDIKTKHFEDNKLSIASTLNNLSALYGKIGKTEDAKKFCKTAVKYRKIVLGKNHPDVGKQLCNLAAICRHRNEQDDAINCYKEALNIFSNTIGPENSHAIKARDNLASLCVETKRYKEAENIYKEILKYDPKEVVKSEEEVQNKSLPT